MDQCADRAGLLERTSAKHSPSEPSGLQPISSFCKGRGAGLRGPEKRTSPDMADPAASNTVEATTVSVLRSSVGIKTISDKEWIDSSHQKLKTDQSRQKSETDQSENASCRCQAKNSWLKGQARSEITRTEKGPKDASVGKLLTAKPEDLSSDAEDHGRAGCVGSCLQSHFWEVETKKT